MSVVFLHVIVNMVQLIFNLTHARIRLLNYLTNISIYSLITCEYSKEQWCKHICVAANRTSSALVWNALVWIYSWTRAEYILLECTCVECIDSYGVHWNHYTSWKPSILYVKLSVKLLFKFCSQTILALATYWFHNCRRCIPYLQFNITYEKLLLIIIIDNTI